jgi:hypothetical protein
MESQLLTRVLANYIVALGHAASVTQRAEDRPICTSLLADAAVLLARAAIGEPAEFLRDAAKAHDRLWGHTWLDDRAFEKASGLWKAALRAINGNVI